MNRSFFVAGALALALSAPRPALAQPLKPLEPAKPLSQLGQKQESKDPLAEARERRRQARLDALLAKYAGFSKEAQDLLVAYDEQLAALTDVLEVEKAAFALARNAREGFGWNTGDARDFADERCKGEHCALRFVLYRNAFLLARDRYRGFDWNVSDARDFAKELSEAKGTDLETLVTYQLAYGLARDRYAFDWGVSDARDFAKQAIAKSRPLLWIDAYRRAFDHARKAESSGGLGWGTSDARDYAESRAKRAVLEADARENAKK